MATNPTLLTQPIAANGAKNVIPNTTSTVGAMSQDQGFPAETSLPLGAGGVAPSREDFNGAFNLLSGLLFYAQKGWQFEFDESQDYFAGCIVRDTLDGKLYEAINDVSASSTHPSADSTNWKQSVDMSAYTTTVNSPMFNKRDIITTSGTYTAPVTGWYKITVKGGGGGGGGGILQSTNQFFGGGGGGEGGTTIAYERILADSSVTVVIGAGGSGGASNVNGTDGGNSTVTINSNTYTGSGGGGGGGAVAGNSTGGVGGSGTVYGEAGGSGITNAGTGAIRTAGGNGGGAGGGISGRIFTPTDGVNGAGGGGGSGDNDATNAHGANGGNGYVWFEYFDSTLNP